MAKGKLNILSKLCCLWVMMFAGMADAVVQAQKPINIVYILSDDHRYDAMGFMNITGKHLSRKHLPCLPFAPINTNTFITMAFGM